MISTENLSFKVKDKILLHNFSAQFSPQKLHLVLGANGAGKSTLIKLLSGLEPPTTGQVFYNEKVLKSIAAKSIARQRAVLSQSVDFAFPLSVNEVVMMGRYPHFATQPRTTDFEIAAQAMQVFGIERMAQRTYNTLSGGEKQRVHFARVFAQIWPENDSPKYLFLDEPLTYLDIKFQLQFMREISGWTTHNNITVIGVLHDLNLAAQFADVLYVFKDGHCITQGSVHRVLTSKNIRDAFGVNADIFMHKQRLQIDLL